MTTPTNGCGFYGLTSQILLATSQRGKEGDVWWLMVVCVCVCALWQALRDHEAQIRQWQTTCEEVHKEKKRRSITVSDMGTEVSKLTKVNNFVPRLTFSQRKLFQALAQI